MKIIIQKRLIHSFFWRSIIILIFGALEVPPETYEFFRGFRFLKYKTGFLLRKYEKFFWSFGFLKCKKFCRGGFLLFFEIENLPPEL